VFDLQAIMFLLSSSVMVRDGPSSRVR
jgi:hypothetical protein